MNVITPEVQQRLRDIVDAQPYPLVFATVSGAHLYGFASPDSDVDLRGVHLLPADEVMGLYATRDTIESANDPAADGGLELDLVTHDVHKFMTLMLKKNGYVLEQLFSPLIVHTSDAHEEMKELGRGCVTRHHVHHYLGFSRNQWDLLAKESPPRVKPLLYVYRVLLTGIHLMQTGEVEANLVTLNERFKLSFIPELIERKSAGSEHERLSGDDLAFHAEQRERLEVVLKDAADNSDLPESPTSKAGLNDLLVRLRRGTM